MDRRTALTLITASAALPLSGVRSYGSVLQAGGVAPGSLFNPRNFGAVGNGRMLDSRAINAAIDACTAAGGGVVYCSPGNYLCGTVELKSNVSLYLEAGAVLLGSTNLKDYTSKAGPDPTSDAGQLHLVYARDATNVSLLGPGRIDGQGQSFWVLSNRQPTPTEKRWSDARHSDFKPKPRVSPMVELVNCTNLHIESVEMIGASGWTMRPINCTRVFIQGIAIRNPAIGPNTDGIDLTGCQNVVISDCVIDTGDDAICLKSENPYGMTPRLAQNIAITNCIITSSTTGFKIGTASQGGFENITFSNSTIVSTNPDLASRMIGGIAIEVVDGGWIEGLVISGIQINGARAPIFLRFGNRSNRFPSDRTGIRGVVIDGIHATEAILTSSITGLPGREVEDVRLSNIHIDTVMPGEKTWIASSVPEVPMAYPQARMFGWLPASGLYCRHVRGLSLRDLTFTAPTREWRTTMLFDDVRQLSLDGFQTTPIIEGVPALTLIGSGDAWITRASAPPQSQAFVRIEGEPTADILISGCDLRGAEKLADVSPEVRASTIRGEFNIAASA
ncbi:MAG: glycoside hydrolase family 28 protein [Janthinobacterium lividum]